LSVGLSEERKREMREQGRRWICCNWFSWLSAVLSATLLVGKWTIYGDNHVLQNTLSFGELQMIKLTTTTAYWLFYHDNFSIKLLKG
jgi:hypothetical protein